MKRYRRTIFAVLLTLAVVLAMVPAACLSAAAAWGGGVAQPSMSTDGYYLIDSGEKLAWFSNRVNAGNPTIKAKQTADVDMGSRPFTPIGTASVKFRGIYNGGGYTIANLKVTGDAEGRGLFGYIGTTATTQTLHDVDADGNILPTTYTETTYTPAEINNVVLTGASVSGSTNVGGIVGVSEGGTIFGCSVAGTVTSTASNAGGIVGYSYSGATVVNCQNDATVSGTLRIGGIAGFCYGATTTYGCCNAGAVTGTKRIGGIAGHNTSGSVHHCYNKGVVTATENSCGGIIGYDMNGELYCMYTIGSISCPGEFKGAILGNKTYGTRIARCYFDRSDTSATDDYATAAEHELMLDASFLETLNFSMEIYVGDYFGTNNGYPILRWQLIGWDGSIGEPETNSSGVYLITNGSELAWFAQLVNGTLPGVAQNRAANAQVMRDILLNPGIFDESSKVWTPIGTESSPFIGTFDGGEHRISGVYLPDNTINDTGLFGYVGDGGLVKNIFLDNSLIKGYNYCGAIAGRNYGTIRSCFNYSTVQSMYNTGGIAGICGGTIDTCGNAGDVLGYYYSGGITGWLSGGAVTSCFNKGKITGVSRTGGILGQNGGVIRYCYNNGRVEGGVSVGGLVGMQNSGSATDAFTACYNIGFVKGAQQVGAVVGYMQNGALTYCYYDTERSGAIDNAPGVEGKTTAQMAEPTSVSAFAGFSTAFWVDRGADQYFDYCPELKVFYNSTNNLLKTTSKESAAVVKGVYTVMAQVDGEMNTYYATVKLGVAHIGTRKEGGTLVLIRDSSITENTVVNGTVTITDNAQTRTLTRASGFTDSFFTVNGALTLEGTGTDTMRLNGGGTAMTGTAPVRVGGTGRVTLRDGARITNNKSSSSGGAVYVDGGTLTMQGGKIDGNISPNGGGIAAADGVLLLEGGTINGNTATNGGGGLFLQGADAEATFSGTTVSGNGAKNGGGLYVQSGSTAEWTDGTLSGNSATQQGGGVYNAGTLRLSGGTVSGNSASSGVGVYQAGTLEMSDKAYLAATDDVYLPTGKTVTNTGRIKTSGTVANLTVQNYAAGTRVLDGEHCAANYAKYVLNVPSGSTELYINSTGYLVAKETHNVAKVSVFGSYDVYYTSLKEAMEAIGAEAEAQAADPNAETLSAMITMIDDDVVEDTIAVSGNVIITTIGQEEDGHSITRFRTCTGAMFNIAEGATLEFGSVGSTSNAALVVDGGSTLYGTYGTCIVENHGTLRLKDGATLQNASSAGDGAAIRNSGTLEILGGLIQNCTSANGGAVWNAGTATMNGGTVQNCSAQYGGAIYNTGTLSFEGGTLTGNTASQNGGGICSASGSTVMTTGTQTITTIDNDGQATVTTVEVTGTLSGNTAKNGGGICIAGGTGTLEAGTITGNSAQSGGGVYLGGGSCTVKGGSITSNTVYVHGSGIYNGASLTVDSAQLGSDCEVYLAAGHTVVPAGTAPSAVLTPAAYTIGTQMLSGSSVAALYGGFTVSNDRFFINASGHLDTTQISIKESSHMSADYTDNVITGIDVVHRTVAELRSEFDNDASSLVFRNKNGQVMADGDVVNTGCVILLLDGSGHTLDTKTFCLVGDVTGDGEMDAEDAVLVYCYTAGMLSKNSSGGAAAYRAADADNNGQIDAADGDLLRACGVYKATVAQP